MVTCSKAGIAGVSCLQRWCGRFPYRPPCANSLPEKITSVKCALMHPKFALAVEQPNWLRAVHHKVGPRGLEMIGRLASKYEKRADNTQHSLMEEAGCWATTAEDLVSTCAAMARVQEWLFFMSFQLKDCAIYISILKYINKYSESRTGWTLQSHCASLTPSFCSILDIVCNFRAVSSCSGKLRHWCSSRPSRGGAI